MLLWRTSLILLLHIDVDVPGSCCWWWCFNFMLLMMLFQLHTIDDDVPSLCCWFCCSIFVLLMLMFQLHANVDDDVTPDPWCRWWCLISIDVDDEKNFILPIDMTNNVLDVYDDVPSSWWCIDSGELLLMLSLECHSF